MVIIHSIIISMSTTKIFIYGVPGVGKTYYSHQLSKNLNLPIIEGDKVKKSTGVVLGTCQAYKKFGPLNQTNVIKGLLYVRDLYRTALIDKIANKNEFILECAFLDPLSFIKVGRVILMTSQDEKLHRTYYLKHRDKLLDLSGDEFAAARIIQEYLIKEAIKLNIEITDNGAN